MYLNKQNNFGEFGYWQFVVGALQAIGYGAAVGTKASAQQKYLDRLKRSQRASHTSQLELKEKELSHKEQLLLTSGQTQLYADERLKKLVKITIIVLVMVTVVGLGSYYVLAVGD